MGDLEENDMKDVLDEVQATLYITSSILGKDQHCTVYYEQSSFMCINKLPHVECNFHWKCVH